MKKFSVSLLVLLMMVFVFSSAFAALKTQKPEFILDQFKMKLGETQSLLAITKGIDDIDGFDTSAPGVIEITAKGYLKAKATGYSTITYTYTNEKDEEVTLKCHVEVTRYDATYDTVTGSIPNEQITHTLELGGYQVYINSTSGAKPSLPKVTKDGFIFDGWYLEPEFKNKLNENTRYGKGATFYAKWVTELEYKAMTTPHSEFYDDIDDHWGKTAIEAISYMGYFTGVGERSFGPDLPMTRAMAVTVIGRMEDVYGPSGDGSGLSDVTEDSYYDGYLAWAIDNKIVTDVKDGMFRPNDNITREEIAVYINNYMNYKKYKVEIAFDPSYTDTDGCSLAAKDALKALYNAGIMQGMTIATFGPSENVTRAQMAQIFYNLYNFTMKYNTNH